MNLQGKIVIYHCEPNEVGMNNGQETASALVLTDFQPIGGIEGRALNLRVFFDNPEISPEGYMMSAPHGNNPGDWSLIDETL